MSNWKNISKEHLDIDKEGLIILINSDAFGNNYAVVKIKDIQELLETIPKPEKA